MIDLKFVIAIIGVFILSAYVAQGQNVMFNWAKSGLKIRSQPGINEKVIGLIPYGGRIHVKSELDQIYPHIEVFEYKNNECSPSLLELSGYWVEIDHQNKTGYVWNGYISRLPALEWRNNDLVSHLKGYFSDVSKVENVDSELLELEFDVSEQQTEGEGRVYKIHLNVLNMTEAFLLSNVIGGILESMSMDDYPLCFSGKTINSLEFKSSRQSISIQQLNSMTTIKFIFEG